MSTDYSVPLFWSRYLSELSGSSWEGDDLDVWRFWHNEPSEARPVIDMLKHVYDTASAWPCVDPEDGVLAVLKAAKRHRNRLFLTPSQVKDMAERFACRYDSLDEPVQDYLDDHHGGLPHTWLSQHGTQQVVASLLKDSEIWLVQEPRLPGVWVFNKPGSGR